MDSIISKIMLFEETTPFVFWSAMCFYVALTIIFLAPPLRKWMAEIFRLPPPSDNYIAFLDVVRGLAILWVASYHSWQWLLLYNHKLGISLIQQGFKGVAVFAILSGFLVWNSLAKSDLHEREIRNFIKRRFTRIYPLLIVTALFSLIMGYVEEGALSSQDIMAEVFMLKVFVYPKIVNPVAWFIYVLFFFYIISPAWFVLARKFRLLSAVIAFIVLSLMATYTMRDVEVLRYFVLGVLTWEVTARIKGLKPGWGWIFLALGLPLIFFDLYFERDFISTWLVSAFDAIGLDLSLETGADTDGRPNFTSVAFGLGVSLFLLSVLKLPRVFNKLSSYPLRFLGAISYSLYMWHGIIIVSDVPVFFDGRGGVSRTEVLFYPVYGDFLSLFCLYFPTFILIAALSYALIERPFMRFHRRAKA